MSQVELFFEDLVADLRHQLERARHSVRRGALEDRIVLLTDHRVAGVDNETAFYKLLGMLRGGRSPVALRVLEPGALAGELSQRWQQYRAEASAPARK